MKFSLKIIDGSKEWTHSCVVSGSWCEEFFDLRELLTFTHWSLYQCSSGIHECSINHSHIKYKTIYGCNSWH